MLHLHEFSVLLDGLTGVGKAFTIRILAVKVPTSVLGSMVGMRRVFVTATPVVNAPRFCGVAGVVLFTTPALLSFVYGTTKKESSKFSVAFVRDL
jgi:hypothetical protein